MAAKADRAFHVALHRQIDRLLRDPGVAQRGDGEAHHDLRPADQRDGVGGSKAARGISVVTTPTWPCQSADRMIDRHLDVDIEPPPPRFELAAEQDVARAARAVEQDDLAVAVALGEQAIERRAQRREAEPAGDDHDVATRPPRPSASRCRTARAARRIAGREPGQRRRNRADRADRVDEALRLDRIAAEADRHLADAEGGQHVELARREGRLNSPAGSMSSVHTRGAVAAAPAHAGDARHHRIGSSGRLYSSGQPGVP